MYSKYQSSYLIIFFYENFSLLSCDMRLVDPNSETPVLGNLILMPRTIRMKQAVVDSLKDVNCHDAKLSPRVFEMKVRLHVPQIHPGDPCPVLAIYLVITACVAVAVVVTHLGRGYVATITACVVPLQWDGRGVRVVAELKLLSIISQ